VDHESSPHSGFSLSAEEQGREAIWALTRREPAKRYCQFGARFRFDQLLRQIYGAGLDDGVGCVGFALGNGGVVTGAVIVGALVLVFSTVVIILP
jgi:hypothetical protein